LPKPPRTEPGRPAVQLLPDLVVGVIQALQFPRNMRWGEYDFAFVRPVRWLLCLYGAGALPLRIPGLPADLDRPPGHSRGHRFLAPGPVEVKEAGGYVEALRAAAVLVDPRERRGIIAAGVSGLARSAAGGTADLIPDLLVETTWLAEHPAPVYGRFDPAFLDLPEIVLTTVMRHHQRYFPVRERAGGPLLPGFVAVRDGGAGHLETVRGGYERVLVARLADARFFFAEDRKRKLASRLPDLAGVVYHERLGSLAEKTARLEHVVAWLAAELGLDARQAANAATAATLSKCDLVTQMVREFPELQGLIGAEYARLEGAPAEIVEALAGQYASGNGGNGGDPAATGTGAGAGGAGPGAGVGPAASAAHPAARPVSPVAAALAIADRADSLVGYHYAGARPTGSEDPYGMRRAAQGIISVILSSGRGLDLRALVYAAAGAYVSVNGFSREELASAASETLDLLLGRIEATLAGQGCAYDEVAAVMDAAGLPLDPVVRRAACMALAEARSRPWFADLVTAAVRASGLGAGPAARDPAVPARPDPALFEAPEEKELYGEYTAVEPVARKHLAKSEFIDYWQDLLALKGPLDRFFDNVLVMAPDPALRANRLALCATLHRLYAHAGDLSRIVEVPAARPAEGEGPGRDG